MHIYLLKFPKYPVTFFLSFFFFEGTFFLSLFSLELFYAILFSFIYQNVMVMLFLLELGLFFTPSSTYFHLSGDEGSNERGDKKLIANGVKV